MFLVPKMTLSLLALFERNQKPELIFDTHLMAPTWFFKNLLLTKIFQMDFQTNNPHKRIFPPKSKVCKCILYCKMSNFGKRKSFFPRSFFQDLSNRQCTCNGWKVVCLWSYSLIIFKNSIIRFPKVSWSLFRACSFGLSTGSGLMLRSLS